MRRRNTVECVDNGEQIACLVEVNRQDVGCVPALPRRRGRVGPVINLEQRSGDAAITNWFSKKTPTLSDAACGYTR